MSDPVTLFHARETRRELLLSARRLRRLWLPPRYGRINFESADAYRAAARALRGAV